MKVTGQRSEKPAPSGNLKLYFVCLFALEDAQSKWTLHKWTINRQHILENQKKHFQCSSLSKSIPRFTALQSIPSYANSDIKTWSVFLKLTWKQKILNNCYKLKIVILPSIYLQMHIHSPFLVLFVFCLSVCLSSNYIVLIIR